MANVLLLRAPSDSEEDHYEVAFRNAGYQSISIPVLETILTNLSVLKSIIKNGPTTERLDGVILTSSRSCVAWRSSVNELLPDRATTGGNDTWSRIPFYVVGNATASALSEIRQIHGQTPYTPEVICGESSGTGERLAQFILDLPIKPKRLLLLTGDKNRDTVPLLLGNAGIDFRSLKVYETRESHTFERDLKQALDQARPAFPQWWIIHFAPSAARMVTPILSNHFSFMPRNSQTGLSMPGPRVAAIGSVTAAFLCDELQIHVHVTPLKPNPQDLVSAIITYDRDSASREPNPESKCLACAS
ncbi:hypothetical protein H0H87_002480 [Tephrocybe sp. NHM501043]|nr:hypothetical protein H0H87_002480 [Tephrocybe sp. NHM501043]